MVINPVTLLFSDFTYAEAKQMYFIANDIVMNGKIPHPYPPWMEAWMVAGDFIESQRLLVVSTVFPARVFLSLLNESNTF